MHEIKVSMFTDLSTGGYQRVTGRRINEASQWLLKLHDDKYKLCNKVPRNRKYEETEVLIRNLEKLRKDLIEKFEKSNSYDE